MFTRRNLIILFFVLVAILAGEVLADDSSENIPNTGIVYGKDHAFSLTAPDDWVLDNNAGRSMGLHAVFYREESSWKNATAVMYANTAHKSVEGNETLKNLIKTDISRFKKNSPGIKIIDAGEVKADGKRAVVRKFTGDKWGNYEAVAYIDESKVIVMLVITSRSKKDFQDFYPSFIELIKSYKFLTSDVIIKKSSD